MGVRKRNVRSIKYVVNLTAEERTSLRALTRRGQSGARRAARARILLKADDGLSDAEIAAAVQVGIATVHRIRQRCVEEGLEAALSERPRSGAPALLSGNAQAHLIAVACSTTPGWTYALDLAPAG